MRSKLILVLLTFIYLCVNCKKKLTLDLKSTKVYGLGLTPDLITLPVRYFFIEAYDTNGKRIKQSLDESFQVQIEGESSPGTYCRVWVQVLDLHDGIYVVRYRTYQTCYKTSINVLFKHRHVAESPYKIEGPVYSEDCYCPVEDVTSWKNLIACPASYRQIMSDLSPFQSVDMAETLEEAKQRFNQPGAKSFCNYIIIKNEIYRKCYGDHVGFNMFMDNILLSLARKMVLPNLDFIVNLGDWPLSQKHTKPLLPIFSWCGSDETADIVMPTYDLTEATIEMMGRVMLDIFSVQSNNKVPWSKKKPMAFWRGRDSRRERLNLITIGRENRELINASLTNFFFFKDEEKEFGPKDKYESFFKFFDNKYQISVDGTVAAYRFPYLLAGSSVVLKQDSSYYEHFYGDLKENIHYIPFKSDLSDLVEKIQWAKNHDDEAKEISWNGRQFAQRNLLPKDVYCYHAVLFQEWSKRITSDIKVREDMEHIPNIENEKRFGNCNCHRLGKHDEL